MAAMQDCLLAIDIAQCQRQTHVVLLASQLLTSSRLLQGMRFYNYNMANSSAFLDCVERATTRNAYRTGFAPRRTSLSTLFVCVCVLMQGSKACINCRVATVAALKAGCRSDAGNAGGPSEGWRAVNSLARHVRQPIESTLLVLDHLVPSLFTFSSSWLPTRVRQFGFRATCLGRTLAASLRLLV